MFCSDERKPPECGGLMTRNQVTRINKHRLFPGVSDTEAAALCELAGSRSTWLHSCHPGAAAGHADLPGSWWHSHLYSLQVNTCICWDRLLGLVSQWLHLSVNQIPVSLKSYCGHGGNFGANERKILIQTGCDGNHGRWPPSTFKQEMCRWWTNNKQIPQQVSAPSNTDFK